MFDVLLNPILPVFAILLIGFCAGRFGVTGTDEARVLNRFAMSVLLPVFIFRAVVLAPIADFAVLPLLVYALTEAVFYGLGFLIARRVFGLSRPEALLLGFCGVFVNNAYYVLPIATILFGEAGSLPITSVIVLDAIVAFGGTMVALEAMAGRDAGAGVGLVARRILGLPLVWALAAGLGFVALGLPLSAPLDTFTAFSGSAASPVALYAMGVLLSVTRLTPNAVSTVFIAMKVVVFPLALLAVYKVMSGTQTLFVMAGAGPTGAMAFSMALLYGVRTESIMQITVWTSILTLISPAYLA